MENETAFEKYLAGHPINDELAALARGEIAVTESPSQWVERVKEHEDDRPLSRAEREALKEARDGGAVTTLSRLLRRAIRQKTHRATIESETDPLGRQAEIAQTWANLVAFRTACTEIEWLIQAEIAALEKDERGQ
jgi:hypothetical protein